ncbi:ceramidase domain-containing protein [Amorphus sp. MBR-141]
MTEALDLYCERTGPSFWSEPLNAVSNVVFIVAAVLIVHRWSRQRGDWPVLALALLTALIGIGSFLFHTLATGWAAIADTAPIAAFIFAYFFLAMRRFLGLPVAWALAATVAYLVASVGTVPFLQLVFGGSASYIPALFGLVGVGAVLAARGDPRAAGLLLAAMLFAVSLASRMADLPVCAAFPIGTHFLWHILNATVLYVAMATAFDRPRRRRSV